MDHTVNKIIDICYSTFTNVF